ncbi:MAG: hypothetical protein JNL79_14995 [Myxococcales bacterium]|nr:hypothetical protein [Myxococcales bacterium]
MASKKPGEWAKAKHKHGSARTLPDLIATMARGGHAGEEARYTVAQALISPGAAYSASAPALDLLARVAIAKGPARAAALDLMLEIVLLGEVPRYLSTGLDLRDPVAKRRYGTPEAQAVVTTARGLRPRLVPLLQADEPQVRASAITLLGFVSTGLAAATELLDLQGEPVADLRVRRIFAAAHVALAAGESLSMALGAFEAVDTLTAAAARVARCAFADTGDLRSDGAEFFRVTLGASRDPVGLDDIGFALLAEGARVAHRRPVALAAADALAAARPGDAARDRWADRILEWYFPLRKGARRAYVTDPLDVPGFSDAQREVLVALSNVMHRADGYGQRGLPPDLRSRRRVLGIDPPGVLEDVLECPRAGKGPLARWRVVRLGLEKYATTSKSVDAQRYLARDWFDLPPARWLELWTEVQARAYGLSGRHPTPADAMEAVPPADVAVWAERYLRECATGVDEDLACAIGWYVALPAARRETVLPPAYDDILTLHGSIPVMREILVKMPAVRRTSLMTRRFAELGDEGSHLAERVAEGLLDVVPEATEPLLHWLERRDDRWTPAAEGTIPAALAKHRRTVRVLDEALRKYAKDRS